MKTPSTSEELATAIESLVASYMDEVRLAAQQAVERSLKRPVKVSSRPPNVRSKGSPSRSPAKRRSAVEIEALGEQLCELVRARPGESMVTLAAELGTTAHTLQHPMAKLKAEGRVRCVGQRHLMRYFPAVVKMSPGVE